MVSVVLPWESRFKLAVQDYRCVGTSNMSKRTRLVDLTTAESFSVIFLPISLPLCLKKLLVVQHSEGREVDLPPWMSGLITMMSSTFYESGAIQD